MMNELMGTNNTTTNNNNTAECGGGNNNSNIGDDDDYDDSSNGDSSHTMNNNDNTNTSTNNNGSHHDQHDHHHQLHHPVLYNNDYAFLMNSNQHQQQHQQQFFREAVFNNNNNHHHHHNHHYHPQPQQPITRTINPYTNHPTGSHHPPPPPSVAPYDPTTTTTTTTANSHDRLPMSQQPQSPLRLQTTTTTAIPNLNHHIIPNRNISPHRNLSPHNHTTTTTTTNIALSPSFQQQLQLQRLLQQQQQQRTSHSPTFQLETITNTTTTNINNNSGPGSRNLSPIPFHSTNDHTNNNATTMINIHPRIGTAGRIQRDTNNNNHPIDIDTLFFHDHLLFGTGATIGDIGGGRTTTNTTTAAVDDLDLTADDDLLLFPMIPQQQQQQTTTATSPPRAAPTTTTINTAINPYQYHYHRQLSPPPPQQQQQLYNTYQQHQAQQSSSLQIEAAYLSMKASYQQQQQLTNTANKLSSLQQLLLSSNTNMNHSNLSSQQQLQPSSYDCVRQAVKSSTISTISSSSNAPVTIAVVATALDTVTTLLHTNIIHERWMDEIQLHVTSISLTPISGYDILQRIQTKLLDVIYKYVPCVDFLVNCQQDLRRGIDTITTQKRYDKSSNSRNSSRHNNNKQLREVQYGNQFYTSCISNLSQQFYNQNMQRQQQQKKKVMQQQQPQPRDTMDDDYMDVFLNDAMKGLVSLQQDAHKVLSEQQQQQVRLASSSAANVTNSCEAIKSAYLGGMKDGESWGLRKWLSKYGGALHICTDLECILNACQKLSRSSTATKLLATQLREMTKPILNYLVKEIPPSYQKHSSAHPYLPFFHRLESALRSMSNFDPEDDDVICLDDDDSQNDDTDDVVEVDNPMSMDRKPSAAAATTITCTTSPTKKRIAIEALTTTDSDNDDDDDDDDNVDNVNGAGCYKRSNVARPTKTTTVATTALNGYNHNHRQDNHKNNNAILLEDDDDDVHSSSGESEVQSFVEIVDNFEQVTPNATTTRQQHHHHQISNHWECPSCSTINEASDTSCVSCGEEILLKDMLSFSRLEDIFDDRPLSCDSNNNNNHHQVNSSDLYLNNNDMTIMGGMSIYNHPSANESSVATTTTASHQHVPLWPLPIDQPDLRQTSALIIANNLDQIATVFDHDQQSSIRRILIPDGSFWDGTQYGNALRLFAEIMRTPESYHFLECVDDDQLFQAGNSPLFSHVIKHPLSLRQIARSLLGDEMQQRTSSMYSSTSNREDGYLAVGGLTKWNMWFGKDLLQAIDLVFLNSLAYGNALNQGRSQHRSSTNQLRKKFWNGITDILNNADTDSRKQSMPTRRAEKSGFVVYKIGES